MKNNATLLLLALGLILTSCGATESNEQSIEWPEGIEKTPSELSDKATVEQGKLPAHASFVGYESLELAERNDWRASSRFQDLSGKWKFRLAMDIEQRPAAFIDPQYNVEAWEDVSVPKSSYADREAEALENWLEIKKNSSSVGAYKRKFQVPAEWEGQPVFLKFEAVGGAFFCWVNGQKVGFNQFPSTDVEFELTDYLQTGTNDLAVEVYHWSAGEEPNEAFWKSGGIEGGVVLYTVPSTFLFDVDITATCDGSTKVGHFKCAVDYFCAEEVAGFSYRITDAQAKELVSSEQFLLNQGQDHLEINALLDSIHPMGEDDANAYRLLITTQAQDGKLLQAIPIEFTFSLSE